MADRRFLSACIATFSRTAMPPRSARLIAPMPTTVCAFRRATTATARNGLNQDRRHTHDPATSQRMQQAFRDYQKLKVKWQWLYRDRRWPVLRASFFGKRTFIKERMNALDAMSGERASDARRLAVIAWNALTADERKAYDEKAIAEWKEAKRLFELPPEGEQLPPNFEAVIRECERDTSRVFGRTLFLRERYNLYFNTGNDTTTANGGESLQSRQDPSLLLRQTYEDWNRMSAAEKKTYEISARIERAKSTRANRESPMGIISVAKTVPAPARDWLSEPKIVKVISESEMNRRYRGAILFILERCNAFFPLRDDVAINERWQLSRDILKSCYDVWRKALTVEDRAGYFEKVNKAFPVVRRRRRRSRKNGTEELTKDA